MDQTRSWSDAPARARGHIGVTSVEVYFIVLECYSIVDSKGNPSRRTFQERFLPNSFKDVSSQLSAIEEA